MNNIKPVRNVLIGLTMAAGLGYVAGGLAINEYSQKKQQSAKATEWIDNLCNNIPELQEQNNLIIRFLLNLYVHNKN